ncbi:MAG TPA: patatin-like phospholipase family protein, partial [Thermoanaerobaculia bacterium]|nr:patatin-like phospholipase family protein [Thermoanaerobaculia bacterium]
DEETARSEEESGGEEGDHEESLSEESGDEKGVFEENDDETSFEEGIGAQDFFKENGFESSEEEREQERRRPVMRTFVLLAALTLGACASAPFNPPLAKVDPQAGYRFGKMETLAREDDVFVMLTFSGGGTRAAALAYGVLQELDATTIAGNRDMLDTVDVISSVSGGSFTAAHYAMYGRSGFEDFRRDFLDQPRTQWRLILSTLYPQNLFRLLSPRFNRIDHAAEFIDRMLFKNHETFANIPKTAPFVILNATEMDIGTRFEFTQEQFDSICSDLGKVPIARGVAASSAFPVLLTPITFRSYASQGCGYSLGDWFELAKNDRTINPARFRYRNEVAALMDPSRKFLHLIDGGVADNIGLRAPIHALRSNDTLQMNDGQPVNGFSIQRLINLNKIRRVVVIVVNAKTVNLLRNDVRRATPKIPSVLSNSSNTPMGNYSFDSVRLLEQTLAEINEANEQLREVNGESWTPVTLQFIEVAFSELPEDEQAEFNKLGTNYALSKKQVADLIDAAGRILRNSQTYKDVVKALQ